GVTEVSIDMWGGYPLVVEKMFPNAQIFYVRFHVMQHVNRELNKLRRTVGVTERGSKYLLLSIGAYLDVEDQEKLKLILEQSPCLNIAYQLKEELGSIYETSKTLKSATRQLKKWLIYAKLFYQQSAQMISSHLEGICNYFISHATSGVMEGINN
ncbi:MAG: transposase, partial [Hormoscilla sp. SP12CHS1]|nr:transposase [Hormoscilla sp. SP12CHS1]